MPAADICRARQRPLPPITPKKACMASAARTPRAHCQGPPPRMERRRFQAPACRRTDMLNLAMASLERRRHAIPKKPSPAKARTSSGRLPEYALDKCQFNVRDVIGAAERMSLGGSISFGCVSTHRRRANGWEPSRRAAARLRIKLGCASAKNRPGDCSGGLVFAALPLA